MSFTFKKSMELLERAEMLIPGATQTFAKGPAVHVRGAMPVFVDQAKGAYCKDIDGNEFLDMNMGIGPVILGYAYEAVDQAIQAQLKKGISFSLVHELEYTVAKLLHELIPNAEMVRFSKTGADVTSAAVRLARAHTGRFKVLSCGYHGWHDWYIGLMDARSAGVPHTNKDLVGTFQYNDIDSLTSQLNNDVAAVILEPMTFDLPKKSFLQQLRDACTENGTVLIYDEMWTGFRFAPGGAQQLFGVQPDLATYSKAIANGMPLSALTGRADLLNRTEEDVFFYTTFGGEALSLAAAACTLGELKDGSILNRIENLGEYLADELLAMCESIGVEFLSIKGHGSRKLITLHQEGVEPLLLKSYFQQEMMQEGVLWGGFHNLSASHDSRSSDHLLNAYRVVLEKTRQAIEDSTLIEKISGRPILPLLRKVENFHKKQ